MNTVELTIEEIELTRQWFDAVQDMNPKYLETPDYVLAKRLYEIKGMRVPNSITEKVPPNK